jgi:protein TonB
MTPTRGILFLCDDPIMADRYPRARNAPAPNPIVKFLPIVIIVLAAAIAAYFFIPRGGNAPAPSATPAAGTPASSTAPTAAAPVPQVPELSKDQLIKEASTAMHESRLISPAGNNAVEFYLKVLEKDPNNNTARDALREMFPIVTPVVEQNINAGQVDEALREIDTLAKADPNNYTLTILRSKLDVKRKQVETEQKQQAAAAAAQAAKSANANASNPAGAAQTPAAPDATTAAPATGSTASTTAAARTAAPPPTAAPTPAPAPPPPPAPTGESRSAELVKSAAPDYPREAFIKHQEGWVEVEFTVTPEGSVTNATVVGAQPPRVFNDAAMRAVQRWTFKPKMDNGKAVEERVKRRIEFKLGAG